MEGLHRPAWRGLLLVATCYLAVEGAVLCRYGYHPDELYLRVSGQHLAWGYPDQPPLLPAVFRAVTAVLGDTLTAVRMVAALLGTATVVLTGLIAREFGGDRGAQVLAAASVAVAPLIVAFGHIAFTPTVDVALWTALTWALARALRTGRTRWWVLAGAVAGAALLNKFLVLGYAGALLAGLLVGRRAGELRRPGPWLGAAVALAVCLPAVVWQARHGWPQLTMMDALSREGGKGGRAAYLPFQVSSFGPLLAPLWVAGAWWLLRSPRAVAFRPLGWAFVLVVLLFQLVSGRFYYPAGVFPAALAAGAVAVHGWAAGPARRRRLALTGAAVALTGLSALVLVVPLAPLDSYSRSPAAALNKLTNDTVGWRQFSRAMGAQADEVTARDGGRPVVLAGTYPTASALDRWGPESGITEVYGGNNAFWYWGPPPDSVDGSPVLAVAVAPDVLRRHWASVRRVATFTTTWDVGALLRDLPVWECTGQREAWSAIWPDLRVIAP